MKRATSAVLVCLLAALTVPVSVDAAITAWSGAVTKIAAPPSVTLGSLQSSTQVFTFEEKQNLTLASSVPIDINAPGTYDENADLLPVGGGVVVAGTVIDSHLVHIDNPSSGVMSTHGTVTFAKPIVGVVVRSSNLDSTDYLGAPGTVYPTGVGARRFELKPSTTPDVVILPDQKTVEVYGKTSSNVDQIRVLTLHDMPPVASAGGPYSATESVPVALHGTTSDEEGDPISVTWLINPWTSDPGTTCSGTGLTTLDPTVTCTDDALVLATLIATDGHNPAVVSVAAVTIGNAPPAVGALSLPAGTVTAGDPVAASVSFADPSPNDTHTATITWGDTTSSVAAVSESAGSGTASANHSYAAPGIYTVTVTVQDDDLGTTSTSGTVVVNGPPTADAAGPYSGAEGSPIGLAGTAVDPDGDPLTIGWTFTPAGADPGTTCTSSGDTTLTPTITCDDDAVVAADLSAGDGVNPPVVSSTTVTVENEAPVLAVPTVTSSPVAAGSPVNVSAAFTDGGANDTHTADIAWGDTTISSGSVTESAGSGVVGATHTFASPGIYTVTVVLTDDDLGVDSETLTIVVNSPPTADAGGPYAGPEGASLALAGTASDADGDALSISWSFATTGTDPGTTCTSTGDTTLTPTISCTDDADVTATLTVDDGVNPPVVSATTVTVGNSAPVLGAVTPSLDPVPLNAVVSVGATFADDGVNDTHTATVDWGDSTSSSASVTELPGSGSLAAAHSYSSSGTYTVTVTVTDDDGAADVETVSVTVNSTPNAGAGGPYSGVEGAALTLSGSADDADGDTLSVSWSFVITAADPGTVCTPGGATTLTPTLLCDDDAEVDVTLTVDDGVNAPVVDTTTVSVSNSPPSVGALTLSANPVTTGTPVVVGASFTDQGVNDNHNAVVNWGDSTTSAAAVTEVPGSGSLIGSHAYSSPGSYTVTVTVGDKDGGQSSSIATILVNAAPSGDAGGPYSGSEGTPVTLAGTASDPDNDPVSVDWSFAVSGADPGTVCTPTGDTTLTPTLTCNDDAVVTATLSAYDGINPPTTSTATVTIANDAPTVSGVTVPISPVAVGTPVSVTASYADDGSNDTHVASIDWEGSSGAGVSAGGAVTGSHTYTAAGTYTVTVTVSDDDGGSDSETATAYVVVYDPSAGFVTGGGWVTSPSGAYTPDNGSDPDYTGKASFGFVSKYVFNQSVPWGVTEFQLRSGNVNMHSTGYSWLVVTDSYTKAYYRGTGKVNGASGYEFLVSVIDGGSSTADKFRIKIWNPTSGNVVYDTQNGAADDDSATLGISCGSIKIHHW